MKKKNLNSYSVLLFFICFLITLLSGKNCPAGYFPQIEYENIFDYLKNPDSNEPVEHIILAGNPIFWRKGEDHNVLNKFELCAMHASTFTRQKDRVVLYFYGKPGDEELIKRTEQYKKLYSSRDRISFIFYTEKNELIEYFKKKRIDKIKISSVTFFAHAFAFGITIGTKNPDRAEHPPKEKDKRKIWYEEDPQHLYPQNFRDYMDLSEFSLIKENFVETPFIAIFGCNTTLLTYRYEKPKEGKYYFIDNTGEKRTFYIVEILNEPVAQAFANIFNATVTGTSQTTLFQTIDKNTGKWIYINDDDSFSPPAPLRMASYNWQKFEVATPDREYKNYRKKIVKLIAKPHNVIKPDQKFADIWESLPEEKKHTLKAKHESEVKRLSPLYKIYEKELSKLTASKQNDYNEEVKFRKELLLKYVRKEREYYTSEKRDFKWINRLRLFYMRKIHNKQKDLHIPLTLIKKPLKIESQKP